MANVISFPQSPLTPFLGDWVRDPVSVSRNKVGRRVLGEAGMKTLWACESIQELRACLEANPDLGERYKTLLRYAATGNGTHMSISPQALVWKSSGSETDSSGWIFPVVRAAAEGKKAVVHTVDTRPGARTKPIAYVLRMNKEWLLVSERYLGGEARIFPPSPTFRYYRAL